MVTEKAVYHSAPRILLLLEKPDQGEILFDGKTVNRKKREEVLAFIMSMYYFRKMRRVRGIYFQ